MREPFILGYRLVRFIVWPIAYILYRPRYINNHLIPKEGGVITCGNHRYYMDFVHIGLATRRTVRFLTKIELFKGPLKHFFNFGGAIPVNRKIKDQNAKDMVADTLKKGALINIFPEGTRNKGEYPLLPLKFGAVSFAGKSGAPIIPYAIIGEMKIFRNKQKTVFGEPIYVKETDDLKTKNEELATAITKLLQKHEESSK